MAKGMVRDWGEGREEGRGWGVGIGVALFDTQIDSIQCLNFAQNQFNSKFNLKSFHENSIQKII